MTTTISTTTSTSSKANSAIMRKQRGYSLVELAIALAIIAVIVVGGLMGTRQILLTNNVNNQLKDTAQVLNKISRQYQRQTSTAGVSLNSLAPLGYWPAERTTINGTNWSVRGVIGGSAELIFPNDADIGTLRANEGFVYTMRNIPSAACADLVSGLDALSYAIYVGKAAAANPTTGATPTTTQIKAPDVNSLNMTNLATGCSSANALVDIVAINKI